MVIDTRTTKVVAIHIMQKYKEDTATIAEVKLWDDKIAALRARLRDRSAEEPGVRQARQTADTLKGAFALLAAEGSPVPEKIQRCLMRPDRGGNFAGSAKVWLLASPLHGSS